MKSQAETGKLPSHILRDRTDYSPVEIEDLQGIASIGEVEALQMKIWSANEAWIVPSHALFIVSEYGGILLGARVDGELAGFVLGFLARSEGALFHASHMLGVLPTCQHRGIGAALKRRQREVALAQGLDLMRWTFDPLEARNAYFNLHKLGTISHVYRTDYYGPMQDGLNRDLPSDRMLVEWRLRDTAPAPPVPASIHTLLRDRNGMPEMHPDVDLPDGPIAVEVPRNLQAVKRKSPEVALDWRHAVRHAFTQAFSQGYVARDFRDNAYILYPEKEWGSED